MLETRDNKEEDLPNASDVGPLDPSQVTETIGPPQFVTNDNSSGQCPPTEGGRQRQHLKLRLVEQVEDQTWTIQRIARERRPPSWEKAFEDANLEIETISKTLAKREMQMGVFYPQRKDIFRAFHLTPVHKVRVVIVGQDPYFQTLENGLPRAVGLSFSVRREDQIPSSLRNIYHELYSCIPGFCVPNHGDLTEWAVQGVLLLNQCLTVDPGAAGSHKTLWLPFVKKMLKAVQEVRPQTIFLLWGAQAQKITEFLESKAIVLTAAHPSGFSASRGFLGCSHFIQVNDILTKKGEEPINWQITPI